MSYGKIHYSAVYNTMAGKGITAYQKERIGKKTLDRVVHDFLITKNIDDKFDISDFQESGNYIVKENFSSEKAAIDWIKKHGHTVD